MYIYIHIYISKIKYISNSIHKVMYTHAYHF